MPVIICPTESSGMAHPPETIDHTTLTRLVEAGVVRGVDVIGHLGGWSIMVKYGMTERMLAARRGTVRSFRKFESLVAYLRPLGIVQMHVNAADRDPDAVASQRARPDASARMRRLMGK